MKNIQKKKTLSINKGFLIMLIYVALEFSESQTKIKTTIQLRYCLLFILFIQNFFVFIQVILMLFRNKIFEAAAYT